MFYSFICFFCCSRCLVISNVFFMLFFLSLLLFFAGSKNLNQKWIEITFQRFLSSSSVHSSFNSTMRLHFSFEWNATRERKKWNKKHTKHTVWKKFQQTIIEIKEEWKRNEKTKQTKKHKQNNEEKQILHPEVFYVITHVSSLTFPFLWHKSQEMKRKSHMENSVRKFLWFNWNEAIVEV